MTLGEGVGVGIELVRGLDFEPATGTNRSRGGDVIDRWPLSGSTLTSGNPAAPGRYQSVFSIATCSIPASTNGRPRAR